MATQPNSPSNTPTPPPSGFEAWTPYLQQIGYGLLAVGGALVVLFVLIAYKGGWTNPTLLTGGVAAGLTLVAAGAITLVPESAGTLAQSDFLRLVVLFTAGVFGLIAGITGLLLPFLQYSDELGTDMEQWREHSGKLTLCIGGFLGGMVLMFVGLSLGRTYERTRPALRRLLYGYNAVFTSLLVVVILVILNLLAYSPVWPFTYLSGQPIDWTVAHLHSLKPQNKETIANLKESAKVYIMMPTQADLTQDMVTLARNCREVNPHFSWETLSPQISDEKIKSLRKDYKIPDKALGALLVYGSEPSSKFRFLGLKDLTRPALDELGQPLANRDGSPRTFFTGETALITALRQLVHEGKPVKVYFTQGNGELDVTKVNSNRPQFSMVTMKAAFDDKLFDMKPLPFDKVESAKGVPADADILVIAGPREPFAQEAVAALRDYLDKKGKLFIMLGAYPNAKGDGLLQTNLEPLLRENGIELGDSLVAYAQFAERLEEAGFIDDPLSLRVVANPDSNNPIAKAFADEHREFRFDLARTVSRTMDFGRPNRAEVDDIIVTKVSRGAFQVPFSNVSIVRLARELQEDKELWNKTVAKQPLALAVAVTEQGKPRMLVFGDSFWASDAIHEGTQLGENNLQLFTSSLAWMVDAPDLGYVVDYKPPSYSLTIGEDRIVRTLFLPGGLMILGVITIGGGVWIVRRR